MTLIKTQTSTARIAAQRNQRREQYHLERYDDPDNAAGKRTRHQDAEPAYKRLTELKLRLVA